MLIFKKLKMGIRNETSNGAGEVAAFVPVPPRKSIEMTVERFVKGFTREGQGEQTSRSFQKWEAGGGESLSTWRSYSRRL